MQSFCAGAHLVSPRTGYSHHGLAISSSKVIHYSGFANGMNRGSICTTDIDSFSGGNGFSVKEHPFRVFSESESVSRANSRIGEDLYDLLLNNCEHFVTWCIYGVHSSAQVNLVLTGCLIAGKAYLNTNEVETLSGLIKTALRIATSTSDIKKKTDLMASALTASRSAFSSKSGSELYVALISAFEESSSSAITIKNLSGLGHLFPQFASAFSALAPTTSTSSIGALIPTTVATSSIAGTGGIMASLAGGSAGLGISSLMSTTAVVAGSSALIGGIAAAPFIAPVAIGAAIGFGVKRAFDKIW